MLLLGILVLLISNAVTLRRDKSILYSRISIFILIYCSFLVYSVLSFKFVSKSISLFGGLLYCKSHILGFIFFIYILCIIILTLTSFYPRKIWIDKYSSLYHLMYTKIDYYKTKIINKMGQQFRIIEYPLIILFIITGAIFLMSSSDLVTIFLSIELQSYGLYLISSIYRNSELSTNAGLTYFLLGGLSSCIILLGQSLLYIHTGNTNLDGIYIINSILVNNIHETYMDKTLVLSDTPHFYEYNIQLSLVIMSTGFLFKISSAPFHFWSPDVYDAIPTIVTTFVAIIAKISILIFFLELVYYTSLTLLDFSWKSNLLMSAFLSLIIGSILGLTQFRIKRLFAYSTISHVGFILLALSINSIESIQAFFFYIMQYSISNLNAFIILITIGYSFVQLTNKDISSLALAQEENIKGHESILSVAKKNILEEKNIASTALSAAPKDSATAIPNYKENETNLQDKNLSPIQLIHQIKGYFYVNPLLAISLSITLFSFIGVPPLIGFFAKQMILSAALDNGYVFMTLIAILTSVISAVYYLVVIQKIFFEKNDYMINEKWNDLYILVDTNKKKEKYKINSKDIFLSSSLTWNISVLTLGILLFIFIPKEIISISNIMSINVFYS